MLASSRLAKWGLRLSPLWVGVATVCAAQAPVPEPATDLETEIGQSVYEELRDAGEIIDYSPLYDSIKSVTEAVSRAAQPHYPHPFKFILLHEAQPNAFSVPGGNVYITDSLLYFVKNTEQLAGTLCHETSHTIHRDAIARMKEQEKVKLREIGAVILLGPTLAQAIAIRMIGDLHSLAYSRDIESSADITGADICATAGYNPWGLVWLFEEFRNADKNQIPALLSDHPANGTRISTLKKHFRDNPSTFSRFDPSERSSTALTVPKNAPEQFLKPSEG